MYDYITGSISEISPAQVIIENGGIGYSLQISLQTYSEIHLLKQTKLYIYNHIREDIHLWYGFSSKDERSIFLQLISVSGIGPNSARVMLSSMNSAEVRNAIMQGDVNRIKSVKGIGLKTAQKIIIELKDKIAKIEGDQSDSFSLLPDTESAREESLSALLMLGFPKAAAEKAVLTVYKQNPSYTLEELIKHSLKIL